MSPSTRLLVIALSLLATACTSEQAYNTGQAYQRNQCGLTPDSSERERCFNQPGASYSDYKAQTAGK